MNNKDNLSYLDECAAKSQIESSFEHFCSIYEKESSSSFLDRNEEQTKWDIIEDILLNVLNWNRDEIKKERSFQSEFSDYELGKECPRMLIEAKRERIQWDLPKTNSARTYKLKNIINISGVTEVYNQAIEYCNKRNIKYAGITNGHQWIFMEASRIDGIPTIEGMCLVFDGLIDIKNNFNIFHDYISKRSVLNNNLSKLLISIKKKIVHRKISESIQSYPRKLLTTEGSINFESLAHYFFDDALKEDAFEIQFLKEAYCPNDSISKYLDTAKLYLGNNRLSKDFEREYDVEVVSATKEKSSSEESSSSSPILFEPETPIRHPILLVGDVGAGKTMFIKHLIKIDARDELKLCYVIYIDFGLEGATISNINNFIHEKIKSTLRESYRINIDKDDFVTNLYRDEIDTWEKSPIGRLKIIDSQEYEKKKIYFLLEKCENLDNHIRKSLIFLKKKKKKKTIIFFDNVDQRSYQFQQDVFMAAQAIAADWEAITFISLRPETLVSSKSQRSLNAYYKRVFHIQPPNIEFALLKRLNFIMNYIENGKSLQYKLSSPHRVFSPKFREFMQIIHNSISSNKRISGFLINMNNNEVRASLQMIIDLISSPIIDIDKYLASYQRNPKFILPFDVFFKSTVLKNYLDFVPQQSIVPNIYSIFSSDSKEHFILSFLLSLFIKCKLPHNPENGTCSEDSIFCALSNYGFSIDQSEQALLIAKEKKLLEVPIAAPSDDLYRITPAGCYVMKLSEEFIYHDILMMDMQICLPEYRTFIEDIPTLSNIRKRLQRCEKWLNYMSEIWDASFTHIGDDLYSWPKTRESLEMSISLIEHELKKK